MIEACLAQQLGQILNAHSPRADVLAIALALPALEVDDQKPAARPQDARNRQEALPFHVLGQMIIISVLHTTSNEWSGKSSFSITRCGTRRAHSHDMPSPAHARSGAAWIDADDATTRTDALLRQQREPARAAADVEHGFAGLHIRLIQREARDRAQSAAEQQHVECR